MCVRTFLHRLRQLGVVSPWAKSLGRQAQSVNVLSERQPSKITDRHMFFKDMFEQAEQ